jgi:hypothetical protein
MGFPIKSILRDITLPENPVFSPRIILTRVLTADPLLQAKTMNNLTDLETAALQMLLAGTNPVLISLRS